MAERTRYGMRPAGWLEAELVSVPFESRSHQLPFPPVQYRKGITSSYWEPLLSGNIEIAEWHPGAAVTVEELMQDGRLWGGAYDSCYECVSVPYWLLVLNTLLSGKSIFCVGTQVDILKANRMIGCLDPNIPPNTPLTMLTASPTQTQVDSASIHTGSGSAIPEPGKTNHAFADIALLGPYTRSVPRIARFHALSRGRHQRVAFACDGKSEGGRRWSGKRQIDALKRIVDYILLAGIGGIVVYGLLARGRTYCRISIIGERDIEIDAAEGSFLPLEEVSVSEYTSRFQSEPDNLPEISLDPDSAEIAQEEDARIALEGLRDFVSSVLRVAHGAMRDRGDQIPEVMEPVSGFVRIRIKDFMQTRAEWEALAKTGPGRRTASSTRFGDRNDDYTESMDNEVFIGSCVPDDDQAGSLMELMVLSKGMGAGQGKVDSILHV